jgi:ribosomal protein L33
MNKSSNSLEPKQFEVIEQIDLTSSDDENYVYLDETQKWKMNERMNSNKYNANFVKFFDAKSLNFLLN